VGLVPPAGERRLSPLGGDGADLARYAALGRLYEAAHAVGLDVPDIVALVRLAFPT